MSRSLGPAFRRLFAASASSNLADGATRVALPLLAASLTREPVLVAALTSLAFLPWLLFTGTASLVVLYVVAFGIGVAETFYDSAARAMLPQVLRRDQLDRGNGLLTVGETAGELFVGAPVGAALFAVAAAAPFSATAAAYGLAAVLVLTIAGRHRPARGDGEHRTSIGRDVAEGVGWLWRHRFLRGLTLVSATTSGLQSLTTGVLVLWALEVLRIGEAGFGLLMTAMGVGAVLGGLVAAPLGTRLGRSPVLVAGAVLAGLATVGSGLTSHGFVAGGLMAVGTVGVMFWNVLTMSLRQALIPEELFGRVQGGYRMLVWGAIPLGALLGGVLADLTTVPAVFVIAGCAELLVAGALWRLLAVHRDVVAGAFAVPAAEPAAAT